MKLKSIRPEFVEFVPDILEEGVLYISTKYSTVSHKCASGCGEIVVTPIHPTDWKLTWDGETVTLEPSIGNWSLPCQSHYWIYKNKIVWAGRWSIRQIESGRAKDKQAKLRYYGKQHLSP